MPSNFGLLSPAILSTSQTSDTVLPGTGPVAPVVVGQNISTSEDAAANIVLTASDANGDILTYTVVDGPTNGVLSGSAPSLTYTPNANYNGSDSFTFKANDGTADSAVATVSITVTAVNDTPEATAQSVSVLEDGYVAITLTGSDIDGNPLTYAVVAGPSNGVLTGNAPNLVYTPNANYNGSDSFTFRVNDGYVNSSTATVSITVTAVNDTPAATAQSVSVNRDTATAITLAGSDVEGSALTYTVVTNPANGSLTGTAPSLTYTPNSGYSGSDSFTFRVNDGTANSAAATVTLTVADAVDASFANVSLLLKADGANNSTSFVDSSANNLAISRLGNAAIRTAQSKFGGSSAYFDGSGDNLSIANSALFSFGTGNFTIECWFFIAGNSPLSAGNQRIATIFSCFAPSGSSMGYNFYILGDSSTTGTGLGFENYQSGSGGGLNAPATVAQNQWHHAAVSRQGTLTRFFLNGALIGSTTLSSQNVTTTHAQLVGRTSVPGYTYDLNGYIDDLRVTKGIARYTANFTPPGSHPVSDPYFSSVSLLMKADGANGSTSFVDSSANAFAVSRVGNAFISTAQSRYGGSSLYFDGVGDYLSVPSSQSLEFGSGNYTIEMWINPINGLANGTQKYLFGKRQSLSIYGGVIGFLQFNSSLNAYRAYYYATTNGTSWAVSAATGDIIPANTWTHLAFVRSGGTFTLYVNGTSAAIGTASGTIPSNGEPLVIGSVSTTNPGTSGYFGHIDDFRITKGVARYTANFGLPGSHPTSGS